MNKIKIPVLLACFGLFGILAFVVKDDPNTASSKMTITVTSLDPSETLEFDAVLSSQIFEKDRKNLHALTTPYELKLDAVEMSMLFKKTSGNVGMRVEVSQDRSKVTASWPISVVLVKESGIQTFGMD